MMSVVETPLAVAKRRAGASWDGLSQEQRMRLVDAVRVHEPSTPVLLVQSPGSEWVPVPFAEGSPEARSQQQIGGSMNDLTKLLGKMKMSGGHGAELAVLQEAVVSTLAVVEENLADMHEHTERHLQRFSEEKAKLVRERDESAAAFEVRIPSDVRCRKRSCVMVTLTLVP